MADLLSMLSEITDADLRARLVSEVTARGLNRPFGLLFEDTVEELDLVDAPIRRGDRVQYRAGGPERLEVLAVKDGVATLRPMMEGHRGRWLRDRDAETSQAPFTELMVTVDHDTSVYPGLVQTGAVGQTSAGRPSHVAIAGENLHALRALRYTHRASVDLIYIDPPYNTGNKEWVYNDRWVDSNDAFRHSKWLAFMRRRLRLAYDLLKDTGVIIVAIGDDEHHRLRMLMDEVFGEQNFISNVVWQGGRKNDSRFVSNGADYMLVYGKNVKVWAVTGFKVKESPDVHELLSEEIQTRGARWRDTKPGVQEVLAQGVKAWAEAEGDEDEATRLMRSWFREQPKDSPVKAMSRNVYFLPDGRLCRDDNITWPGGGGPKYDVLHPTTGKPVPVPDSGWRYSTPERMQQAIDEGWVIFRDDHTKPISLKKPLETVTGQVALSVFDRQRTHGSRHLYSDKGTGVFLGKRFENPKDHTVLMRWFRMAAPRDAVVLDFFGGSGSTAEAVLRLNAEDGGTRQAILVTSNEVSATEEKKLKKAGHLPGSHEWKAAGVFERVTRPRLTTILTGERDDGSVYDSPVGGEHSQCVEFFDLTYVSPRRARLNLEWKRLAPLLWMRGGALGGIPARADKPYVVTEGFAAMWGGDHAKDLAAELTDQRVVFIVTDSEAEFVAAAKHFDGFECRHLWNDYLGEN